MDKNNKLTFWKKIKISIFDFEKYQDLASERISKTIVYIAIIMLIFSIVATSIYSKQIIDVTNNIKTYISDNIEEITFEDNILNIIPKNKEEVTKVKLAQNSTMNVIINTQTTDEIKIQESIDEIKSEDNGILILKDRIMLKNNLMENPQEYAYKDIAKELNINKIDKQEAMNLLSGTLVSKLCLSVFATLFIAHFSSTLIDILVLSVLAYMVALIVKLRLKFSVTYNIAAYSLTLSILLNIVYLIINSFTGFIIKYFNVMYIGLASIYIITVILMIRADVIKQQIELSKIIQEQDKVAEELKRLEEEGKQKGKDENEEGKDNEKEDDKKENKSKDNKPDINVGKEPEGNNV